jgi:hypothetical protein
MKNVINDVLDDAVRLFWLRVYLTNKYSKFDECKLNSVSYDKNTKTAYADIYYKPIKSVEYINISFSV